MSNTASVKLNESQKARATQIAQGALSGFTRTFFVRNGREPTSEEARAFVSRVAENAINSILKSDPEMDALKRASALKAINELASLNGIKFTHRREVAKEIEAGYKTGQVGGIDYINYVESTRGGNTIAFKYALDGNNGLFMEYAVAFCRADENFDPLIGKQEALKKFLAGDIISAPITHEPFGPVKLDQLTSVYKAHETAAKAQQPQ